MDRDFERDGFCCLQQAVDPPVVVDLLTEIERWFADSARSGGARSSRNHVYAARNLIGAIPEVAQVWKNDVLLGFLGRHLGDDFGLVRALYFDKPPDRMWALPWHKDNAIAVQDNQLSSTAFSRPTNKAGVPHVIACDEVMRRMVTLRIHLDDVTDENGPLRVIPGSHVSSESDGEGVDSAITVHARAGDVLAMRPLISHSSGASKPGTQMHRRILHLEFSADRELPDEFRWHTFLGE